MTTDPFTEVLQKLWQLLESRPVFTTLVASRNRITLWEGRGKPEKTKHSIADLPEVTIIPIGGAVQPAASSTGAKITQIYRIIMVDGDLRLNKVFFPLKWAIVRSLASIDENLGLTYVRRIMVSDSVDEKNEEKHPGWNMGIDIEVDMWFDRTKLKLI